MLENYITKVSVKNYRSLTDLSVELSPLTVLVGANGSGKSNFIDVFRFVADALQIGLDDAVNKRGGIAQIRRWSFNGHPVDVIVTLELRPIDSEYSFTLGSKKLNEFGVKREYLRVGNSVIFERSYSTWKTMSIDLRFIPQQRNLVLPLISEFSEVRSIYDFLANMSFYSLFPNNLRAPQQAMTSYPLSEHGENLASVLKRFLDESEWAIELKNVLELLIPHFNDLDVKPISGYWITRIIRDDRSAFNLAQESDGTIRLIANLLALYQDPPRSMITIEEPELFIHPGAMGVLCDVIKGASIRSQIIISTHNPDLIDRFDIDDLRIVERTDEGTEIGRLDEDQREVVKEKLFSAGELLMIEGLQRSS